MNDQFIKKVAVGGLLVVMVIGAMIYMVVDSHNLLTIRQPETSTNTAVASSSQQSGGSVLGDSTEKANPLEGIYINPFAQ